MAKYSADITKNAGVATADPGSAMRAATASSQMLETLMTGVKQGVNAYNEYTIAETRKEAKEAQSIFFNEAFEQPKALQGSMQQAVGENEERAFGSGMDSPDSQATINSIKKQMAQWQAGVDQGRIGLAAYQNRIQDLAKRSVAAAPWLGLEIRQTIMDTTGLPYIDRETTAAYFTRQMMQGMGKEEKKGEDWQKKKDFDLITSKVGISYEQLEKLYQSDPQQYAATRRVALDKIEVEQKQANLTAAKAATEGVMWSDANKATSLLIAEAGVGVYSTVNTIMQRHSGLMKNLAGVGVGTDLAQAPGLKAQLDIVQGELGASIKSNTMAAKQALLDKRGLMSKNDFDAQMERITGQEKLWMEAATPQNIGTTLQILSTHREKSLDERLRMVTAYSGFITAYGETDLVKAILTGDEDMKAQIERVRPGLVAKAEAAFSGSTDSLAGAAKLTGTIGGALADAKVTPNATPVNPGQSKDDVRDSTAIVDAEALSRAKKWAASPAAGIDPATANVFGTMLSNNSKGMADGVLLRGRRAELTQAYQAMPSDLKPSVTATVANEQASAMQSIIAEMGDKLKVGTMPDGRIVVMPPMDLLRPAAKTGSIKFVTKPKYFSDKYKVYEDLVIIEGKEKEYQAYENAARAFENQRGNQLRNMANVRAIALNGEPIKFASDIALQLNKREVVPFATYEPKAVEEPEKKTGGKGFYAGTVQGVSTKPRPEDSDTVFVLNQTIAELKEQLKTAPDTTQKLRIEADIRMAEAQLEKEKAKK